jgi:hypothetical protein
VVREAQGKLTKVREKPSLTNFHRFFYAMYLQNDAKFAALAKHLMLVLALAIVSIICQPLGKFSESCKSQQKMKEGFFGECELSKALEKSGKYLYQLNLHVRGHMLELKHSLIVV